MSFLIRFYKNNTTELLAVTKSRRKHLFMSCCELGSGKLIEGILIRTRIQLLVCSAGIATALRRNLSCNLYT